MATVGGRFLPYLMSTKGGQQFPRNSGPYFHITIIGTLVLESGAGKVIISKQREPLFTLPSRFGAQSCRIQHNKSRTNDPQSEVANEKLFGNVVTSVKLSCIQFSLKRHNDPVESTSVAETFQ